MSKNHRFAEIISDDALQHALSFTTPTDLALSVSHVSQRWYTLSKIIQSQLPWHIVINEQSLSCSINKWHFSLKSVSGSLFDTKRYHLWSNAVYFYFLDAYIYEILYKYHYLANTKSITVNTLEKSNEDLFKILKIYEKHSEIMDYNHRPKLQAIVCGSAPQPRRSIRASAITKQIQVLCYFFCPFFW